MREGRGARVGPVLAALRWTACAAAAAVLASVGVPQLRSQQARPTGDPPPASAVDRQSASGAAPAVDGALDGASCPADAPRAKLDVVTRTLDSRQRKLSEFGNKVILLNFWATWCRPCRTEVPVLEGLQKKYRDQLVVIGVAVNDSAAAVQQFTKQQGMSYPVVLANDAIVEAFGPLTGIPMSVAISRDGRTCSRRTGAARHVDLERDIMAALAAG